METSQSGQAKCSENKCSLFGNSLTKMRPLPIFSANSMDSVKRSCMSFFIMSRSTTTSMVCFLFLFKMILSSTDITSPSTRTRRKPSFLISSKTPLCCPLRPRIRGAKICILVPDLNFLTVSTIC